MLLWQLLQVGDPRAIRGQAAASQDAGQYIDGLLVGADNKQGHGSGFRHGALQKKYSGAYVSFRLRIVSYSTLPMSMCVLLGWPGSS